MKSILGHTVLSNDLQVTIFKVDGIPESGHMQYSMLVFSEIKGLHYLVNWDGYTSNRLSVLGSVEKAEGMLSKFSDDELLTFELQLIEWVMNHYQFPEENVTKFLNLEGYELKQGSLVETN